MGARHFINEAVHRVGINIFIWISIPSSTSANTNSTERPRCSVIIRSQQKYDGTSNMAEFRSSSPTPSKLCWNQGYRPIYLIHTVMLLYYISTCIGCASKITT